MWLQGIFLTNWWHIVRKGIFCACPAITLSGRPARPGTHNLTKYRNAACGGYELAHSYLIKTVFDHPSISALCWATYTVLHFHCEVQMEDEGHGMQRHQKAPRFIAGPPFPKIIPVIIVVIIVQRTDPSGGIWSSKLPAFLSRNANM